MTPEAQKEPTADDAKQYCPMNTKHRGSDDQQPLFEFDYDEGNCKLDGEKCHYKTCSTLIRVINYDGECP